MRNTVGLLLLALGLFLSGTNAFVIAGLLPDIAEALNSNQSEVGLSVTWYAIVIAVAAPAVTMGLTRVSRTVLLSGGLLLMAAGTLVTLIADSITVFTIGRCVAALGGAALVPTAMSVATLLVPAHRRGFALSTVALGFTLATALGAPAGTWLGGVGGWRTPFVVVLVAAVILAGAIAITLRRLPLPAPASFMQRMQAFRDRRISLALAATVFITLGFNIVYIFAARITEPATHGDAGALAGLLLVLGLGGVAGNLLAGPTIDRFGNGPVVAVTVLLQVIALGALPFVSDSMIWVATAFAAWGAGALAAPVGVQHRLATIDPQRAAQALAWFASAQYLGIALAPVASTLVTGIAGARWTPWVSAGVLLVAAIVFELGRRSSRPSAAPSEGPRLDTSITRTS